MDAEKNVVEAARRARDSYFRFGGGMSPEHGNAMIALRAALYAYDSAPDPSEDRVREAAGAVHRAEMKWSNDNDDMRSFDEVRREALRPYVTPAPALPEGTVAVEVSLLKRWRVAMSRCIATNGSPTHNLSLPEIDAILPPPKPEPPKELVAEWAREARAAAADLYISTKGQSADGFRSGYVAALRAAWEAKGGA